MENRRMSDISTNSGNPLPIIGSPERKSSMMELYEYHKNNGSLAAFYDLYPESRPRQLERADEGRER